MGKGTGLGRSMVYGFIKQSNGHLKVDSTPGKGPSSGSISVRDAYTHQIASGAIFLIRPWGETEDVGKAVAGLVSGDIPFSTGDSFYVDGGLHIPRF